MEYFVFEQEKRLLHVRDGVTTVINRLTMKVTLFEVRDGYYRFALERHEKLGYQALHLPIQNTVLAFL